MFCREAEIFPGAALCDRARSTQNFWVCAFETAWGPRPDTERNARQRFWPRAGAVFPLNNNNQSGALPGWLPRGGVPNVAMGGRRTPRPTRRPVAMALALLLLVSFAAITALSALKVQLSLSTAMDPAKLALAIGGPGGGAFGTPESRALAGELPPQMLTKNPTPSIPNPKP